MSTRAEPEMFMLNDGSMTLEFRNFGGNSAAQVRKLRRALESGATIAITAPMFVEKMDSTEDGVFFKLRLSASPKIG